MNMKLKFLQFCYHTPENNIKRKPHIEHHFVKLFQKQVKRMKFKSNFLFPLSPPYDIRQNIYFYLVALTRKL